MNEFGIFAETGYWQDGGGPDRPRIEGRRSRNGPAFEFLYLADAVNPPP
jgi:hypothetical protein